LEHIISVCKSVSADKLRSAEALPLALLIILDTNRINMSDKNQDQYE